MSDDSDDAATGRRANHPPKKVGRNNPPEKNRFKPGGPGGPGRPKNSRNRTDFDVVFDEAVQIGTDPLGRPIRKTARRVGNMQLRKLVMEGNLQAIKIMKDYELKLAAMKVSYAEPPPTIEDLRKQQEEDDQRQALSCKIIKYLEKSVLVRKEGWYVDEHGIPTMAPWLEEAISDYKKKIASR